MKRLSQKLLVLILAIAVVFTMSSVAVAAESAPIYTVTVESYSQWLLSSTYNSSSSTEQALFLSEFESLTDDQQQLFVSYLNDEDLMKSVFETFINTTETTTYANGDIKIAVENNFDEVNTLATTYTTKATHTRTVQFLGIDVVEVSNYVTYTHTSSTVTGVVRGGMVTGRNFVPFLGISYSNDALYVQSNRAYHVSDLTCEFLYEGSGIVFGSAEFGVYGTASGGVGYWVTPY